MQKELAYDNTVVSQVFFKVPDIFKSLLPDILGDELGRNLLLGKQLGMNTYDESLFVVRSIEDPDAPALGKTPCCASLVTVSIS